VPFIPMTQRLNGVRLITFCSTTFWGSYVCLSWVALCCLAWF